MFGVIGRVGSIWSFPLGRRKPTSNSYFDNGDSPAGEQNLKQGGGVMEKRLAASCMIVLLGYSVFSVLSYQEPVIEITTEEASAISDVNENEEIVDIEEEDVNDIKEIVDVVAEPNPCELVRQEVEKYDWDTNVMMAIAMAESHCNPEAVGDTSLTYEKNGRTYGYSVGAFQIRILEGREECDTFDIGQNVACAYKIYKGQGLKAWSVYNNGKYKDYL